MEKGCNVPGVGYVYVQETLNIVQSESRPDGKPINFLNINLALSSIQNTLLHLRCHFQNYQPIKNRYISSEVTALQSTVYGRV